jgi:hypothetical protein
MSYNDSLTGQRALVTGGSKGIGAAIVSRLALAARPRRDHRPYSCTNCCRTVHPSRHQY